MNNYNQQNPYQYSDGSNQMNNDQNFDPYTKENPHYNKAQFREMLKSMSPEQRERFLLTLQPEFVNSERMPSIKEKSTLIILSVLGLLIPFISINRLYAGRIVSGIIKMLLVITAFVTNLAVTISSGVGYFTLFTVFDKLDTIYAVLFIITTLSGVAAYVWNLVDIILSANGKIRDKDNRKIDI